MTMRSPEIAGIFPSPIITCCNMSTQTLKVSIFTLFLLLLSLSSDLQALGLFQLYYIQFRNHHIFEITKRIYVKRRGSSLTPHFSVLNLKNLSITNCGLLHSDAVHEESVAAVVKMGINLRFKDRVWTRNDTSDYAQRSAATIVRAHKHTLKQSSCHKQGETSCSSFSRRLRSLHGLAGFTETINPYVDATDGQERSTMRKQRGRGTEWWVREGLDNTFSFSLFFKFYWEKENSAVEKQIPLTIFPQGHKQYRG